MLVDGEPLREVQICSLSRQGSCLSFLRLLIIEKCTGYTDKVDQWERFEEK